MKRIFSLFLCIILMISSSSVAFAGIQIETENNDTQVSIHITGAEKDEPVVVQVENEKGRVFIDQVQADQEGKVTFNALLETGEHYEVTAVQEDEKAQTSLTVDSKQPVVRTNRVVVEETLEKLSEEIASQKTYTFREAVALAELSSEESELEKIVGKYRKESIDAPTDYAGIILANHALGQSVADEVKQLVESQRKDGYFEIGKQFEKNNQVIWSMIALDKAEAAYEIDEAIEIIAGAVDKEGCIEDVDLSSMALMALGPHTEDNVKAKASVEKIKGYLKSQLNVVLQEKNTCTLSSMIQGLMAIGEDPLADEWHVKGNNLVNSLIASQVNGQFKNAMSKEQALLALIDLKSGESMYTESKIDGDCMDKEFVQWTKDETGGNTGGETGDGGDAGEGGDNTGNGNTPVTPVPKDPKVSVSIKGTSGYILSRQTVVIEDGDTVMDVTRKVMDDKGINYSITHGGSYMAEIDGLAEFDKGSGSGWLYKVNGKFQKDGAADTTVSNGMNIQWIYTVDYTKEPGNKFDDDSGTDGGGFSSSGTAVEIVGRLEEELSGNLKSTNFDDYAEAVSVGLEKLAAEKDTLESSEVEAALETFSKVANKLIEEAPEKKTAISVAENILKNYKQVNELATTMDEKQLVSEKVQDIAETLLTRSTSIEVEKDAIVKEQGRTVIKIDQAIKALNRSLERDIKKVSSLLEKNDLDLKRALKPVMTVKVPTEAEVISVQISEKTRKALEGTAAEILRIQTADANVCVDPSMLSSLEGGIELTVREITALSDDSEGGSGAVLPENTLGKVLDFELCIGQENQDTFNEPIEIELPVETGIKDTEKLTVYYLDSDGNKELVGGYYDHKDQVMRFKTNHFSTFYVDYATVDFADMKDHDLKDEVQLAVARGILQGRSDGSFDPDSNLTRAEFAQMLCNILKPGATTVEMPFKDIDEDDWFAEGVAAAYEMDLISGRSDSEFDPYGTLTRQEIAVVVSKILEKNGYGMAEYTVLMDYPDYKAIAPWAVKGVSTSVQYGMIREGHEGEIDPDAQVSRAELTEILNTLYTLIYQ